MNPERPASLAERCMVMAGCVLVLCLQLAGLLAVVGVVLTGAVAVSDVIDARLMAMDHEPPEGWVYWQDKYQREALASAVVPLLAAAGICGLLLWRMGKRVGRIREMFG